LLLINVVQREQIEKCGNTRNEISFWVAASDYYSYFGCQFVISLSKESFSEKGWRHRESKFVFSLWFCQWNENVSGSLHSKFDMSSSRKKYQVSRSFSWVRAENNQSDNC
jgi:hypothetical protein